MSDSFYKLFNGGYGSGRYDHRSILPIGSVNLNTHSNGIFGKVWHGWPEGNGANIAIKDSSGNHKIIHTSDSLESSKSSHPVGQHLNFKHDQTFRNIPGGQVSGVFEHSLKGMQDLKSHIGKNSANFYTYK